jgi:hypothetical protein
MKDRSERMKKVRKFSGQTLNNEDDLDVVHEPLSYGRELEIEREMKALKKFHQHQF